MGQIRPLPHVWGAESDCHVSPQSLETSPALTRPRQGLWGPARVPSTATEDSHQPGQPGQATTAHPEPAHLQLHNAHPAGSQGLRPAGTWRKAQVQGSSPHPCTAAAPHRRLAPWCWLLTAPPSPSKLLATASVGREEREQRCTAGTKQLTAAGKEAELELEPLQLLPPPTRPPAKPPRLTGKSPRPQPHAAPSLPGALSPGAEIPQAAWLSSPAHGTSGHGGAASCPRFCSVMSCWWQCPAGTTPRSPGCGHSPRPLLAHPAGDAPAMAAGWTRCDEARGCEISLAF